MSSSSSTWESKVREESLKEIKKLVAERYTESYSLELAEIFKDRHAKRLASQEVSSLLAHATNITAKKKIQASHKARAQELKRQWFIMDAERRENEVKQVHKAVDKADGSEEAKAAKKNQKRRARRTRKRRENAINAARDSKVSQQDQMHHD